MAQWRGRWGDGDGSKLDGSPIRQHWWQSSAAFVWSRSLAATGSSNGRSQLSVQFIKFKEIIDFLQPLPRAEEGPMPLPSRSARCSMPFVPHPPHISRERLIEFSLFVFSKAIFLSPLVPIGACFFLGRNIRFGAKAF